jgi:hypothetical protein
MIVYSFLDEYDLLGKTIAPFRASGGSGFLNTINAIKLAESNAMVLDGLHISDSAAPRPGGAVSGWLDQNGKHSNSNQLLRGDSSWQSTASQSSSRERRRESER